MCVIKKSPKWPNISDKLRWKGHLFASTLFSWLRCSSSLTAVSFQMHSGSQPNATEKESWFIRVLFIQSSSLLRVFLRAFRSPGDHSPLIYCSHIRQSEIAMQLMDVCTSRAVSLNPSGGWLGVVCMCAGMTQTWFHLRTRHDVILTAEKANKLWGEPLLVFAVNRQVEFKISRFNRKGSNGQASIMSYKTFIRIILLKGCSRSDESSINVTWRYKQQWQYLSQ